jgi:hypothetical protein
LSLIFQFDQYFQFYLLWTCLRQLICVCCIDMTKLHLFIHPLTVRFFSYLTLIYQIEYLFICQLKISLVLRSFFLGFLIPIPVSIKSGYYEIWQTNINISNENLGSKSPLNWSFDIKNGLIGIERDIFLLLLGYGYFNVNNSKTRNVRMFRFSFFFSFFFIFYFRSPLIFTFSHYLIFNICLFSI